MVPCLALLEKHESYHSRVTFKVRPCHVFMVCHGLDTTDAEQQPPRENTRSSSSSSSLCRNIYLSDVPVGTIDELEEMTASWKEDLPAKIERMIAESHG